MKVIAHRGASGERPENTLAAYWLAAAQRADMIEIDLHRTRDGAIPITHDATLGHLGGRGEIAGATLAEGRALGAGVSPWSAAWSLSHIGPMTRTVADAPLMLTVAAGPDPRDQFSLPAVPADYARALRGGIKGLRVAWSPDLGYAPVVDPEIQAVCERAARRFRELGCRVDEMRPGWPSPMEAWETIFCGSIAARMEPYLRQKREDVEPGLAAIVDDALGWAPTRYLQAWFDRMAWYEHPRRLFEKYDLLLTPTIACPPFPVGLDNTPEIAGRRVRRCAWLPFTPPFNLTGQPAASVPCGFTKDGLPVGLQIVGRRFDDATV